jgi:superfamily I DNA/RNA helicase
MRDLEDERRIAYVGMARARVSALGTRPSDTATTSGPGRALALQFAHPHLGHESKYAPIIARQRKEPCP